MIPESNGRCCRTKQAGGPAEREGRRRGLFRPKCTGEGEFFVLALSLLVGRSVLCECDRPLTVFYGSVSTLPLLSRGPRTPLLVTAHSELSKQSNICFSFLSLFLPFVRHRSLLFFPSVGLAPSLSSFQLHHPTEVRAKIATPRCYIGFESGNDWPSRLSRARSERTRYGKAAPRRGRRCSVGPSLREAWEGVHFRRRGTRRRTRPCPPSVRSFASRLVVALPAPAARPPPDEIHWSQLWVSAGKLKFIHSRHFQGGGSKKKKKKNGPSSYRSS